MPLPAESALMKIASLSTAIFLMPTCRGSFLLPAGSRAAICRLIHLSDTGLQDIQFKDCKLSGADFSKSCDFLFEVNFTNCILDNAIFYKKKNKGAKFTDCSMVETDFTWADLSDVQFNNCNLNRAFFNRTILKNADFRTAYNFIIDPDINTLKKAKFSVHGLPGLLAKYDIRIEG